jgi:hypothetical protein
MSAHEENIDPVLNPSEESVDSNRQSKMESEIMPLLENLSERVAEMGRLVTNIYERYDPNTEMDRQTEKSKLYKIETKVDNLHRIFELATHSEKKKINAQRGRSTKRERIEDLKERIEREMARTLMSIKKKSIQR